LLRLAKENIETEIRAITDSFFERAHYKFRLNRLVDNFLRKSNPSRKHTAAASSEARLPAMELECST